MRAADDDLFAVYRAGNTVCDQIFHLRVHLFVCEIALFGCTHDRICHRVREVFFQTGGNAQHLALAAPAERDDLRHPRAGVGQRAGFVKDDGIRFGRSFEEFAALDRDVLPAGLAHGGQHCQRHGELECTGKIHHQHGQRAGDIACEPEAEHAARKRIGYEFVRQMGGAALCRAFELLGLLDHGDDFVIPAAACVPGDLDHAVPFFHDRTRVDMGARPLGDRQGLAGERGLVDHDLTLGHAAVERDDAAHAHDDLAAFHDL